MNDAADLQCPSLSRFAGAGCGGWKA